MGAAVRKATRQSPIDDTPRTRGVPNKRNTKLWCKGKVGVEHKPAVKTWFELKNWQGAPTTWKGWLVLYCSECGKELQSYVPPFDNYPLRKPHVVPDWAAKHFAEHPEDAPEPPARRR